jgi:hypothetical protein
VTNENHPDPITEGLTRVGQVFALAATGIQVTKKVTRHLRDARARRDEAAEAAAARQLQGAFDDARSQWAPVHDREWLQHSDVLQVATAMAAAVPYAEEHVPATSAVRKCEGRLRELHPHGMEQYDRLRRDGMSQADAMLGAARYFDNDPYTRTSDPVSRRALAEGTDSERSLTNLEHGPGREGWETSQQTLRAQHIVDDIQHQRRTRGKDELRPDELRTVLEVTTNLTDDIIAMVAPTERERPSAPGDVATEGFPLSIDDAMAMTGQQPHARPAEGKPRNPVVDRNRRPSR